MSTATVEECRVRPGASGQLQHLKAGIERHTYQLLLQCSMDVCLGSPCDRRPHVFIKAVSVTKKEREKTLT